MEVNRWQRSATLGYDMAGSFACRQMSSFDKKLKRAQIQSNDHLANLHIMLMSGWLVT